MRAGPPRGRTAPRRLTGLAAAALTAGALLAACASAPATAPAQPYPGLETRPIKALSPERVADLLAGRGASYALAAELNHFPGPRHVLDLAGDLALTPEQERAARETYAAMQAEAQRLGEVLVEREGALDRAFAEGAVTPEQLRRLTDEIAATDGELRAVHLRAHLTMKSVLTAEQVTRYDHLRGYAGDTAPAPGDHGATKHG